MIPRKKKVCKGCGHEDYVWSHGLCKQCAAKNYKPSSFIKQKANSPTGEKAMFDMIWEASPHLSYVSGTPLDRWEHSPLYVNMFSHILPKGKYPLARLDERNIVLLTPQEHIDWHSYTKEKLLSKDPRWIKVFELYDKLKEEYDTK